MITVVTPAATRLLTTRQRVKDELGITVTTYDTLLDTKIAEVSDEIAAFCGRDFGLTAVTETLRRWCWTEDIILARWPVVAISALSEAGTALTSSDWFLDTPGGVLRRLNTDGTLSVWRGGDIVVSYTYGWLLPGQSNRNLPLDVEAAAVDQVKASWFARKRDPVIRSETVDGVGSQSFQIGSIGGPDTGALQPDVARRLERYTIVRVG
jgi:hypothetical protein